MKNLFLCILFLVISSIANAEPHPRQIRYMCASFEELEMTLDKYGEKLVIATRAPNGQSVNMLFVNFKTQTSSWIVRNLQTDEYCMIGAGDNLLIPKIL